MSESSGKFLSGRHVVITGVGRAGQTGEVIARTFAEHGATPILVDRTLDNAGERSADLVRGGFSALPFACDLSNEEQVAQLAADVAEVCGEQGVAALVNAAGGFGISGNVTESTVEVWNRQFAINLTTCFLTTRAMLPLLRLGKGAIVNFATAAALTGSGGARMSAYVAAKSGVIALTRVLAQEERDTGVRVNAVAPSAIRTAANERDMPHVTKYVEREEVAETVLFLCSPAASAISGDVIRLA
jgi:NAD(P)-dependent dehydrogenase (short-subunit alcohol dehydrogenase family)